MDDTPAKKTPGDNINKLDLSALEAFQFGTQWDESGEGKHGAGDRGHHERSRESRESGAPRRDRRPPRRESSHGVGESRSPAQGPPERGFRGGGGGYASREGRGEGGPRPYREQRESREAGGGAGGGRFERGPRREGDMQRRPPGPPRPYQSPDFEVTFYPDDHGFNALVKAMRASSRTYELFEIARLILGKLERCVVVYRRRAREGEKVEPLFVSVPDGLPFASEEEAVAHALDAGLTQFFDTETVQVEPPKGTFQFVNRCPITKELLGPPNYHRYAQILQNHYASRGIHMPFDRYKASIEVVRDEEAVKAWLESMKTATRYTFKGESPEGPAVFDNAEDARVYLLRTSRDKLVRPTDAVRVPAKVVEAAGRTEAARAMHGMLETQRRFPLDTANALRGRLRRENFHIFKRGSKGVTYVCAVRRKFRQPGQLFSDSIRQLIEFLDEHPLVPVGELAPRVLGIVPPAPPAPPAASPAPSPPPAPPVEAPGASAPAALPGEATETQPATPAPEPAVELTPEQRTALNRLALDLRWLVSEGYVAEYSDGRLYVHPVMEPDREHLEESPQVSEGEVAPEPAPDATSEGEVTGEPESESEPPPDSMAEVETEAPASGEGGAEEPSPPSEEAAPQSEEAAPPSEEASAPSDAEGIEGDKPKTTGPNPTE